MHAAVDVTNFIPLPIINKEVVAPRHRRKKRDEETNTNSSQTAQLQNSRETLNNSKGHQFDLVEEAFPPLPGKYYLVYL